MSNVTVKKSAPIVSDEVRDAVSALTTIASKVRYLLATGMSRGDISRYLTATEGREVRYQWIRNIELTPLKKG